MMLVLEDHCFYLFVLELLLVATLANMSKFLFANSSLKDYNSTFNFLISV